MTLHLADTLIQSDLQSCYIPKQRQGAIQRESIYFNTYIGWGLNHQPPDYKMDLLTADRQWLFNSVDRDRVFTGLVLMYSLILQRSFWLGHVSRLQFGISRHKNSSSVSLIQYRVILKCCFCWNINIWYKNMWFREILSRIKKRVMKLNLKGEGGGGAFQSNSERCLLALIVMTHESIQFNTVYLTQHV